MTAACPLCGSTDLALVFEWREPPPGETAFPLPPDREYGREFRRCAGCGLYIGLDGIGAGDFYGGAYVESAYGDRVAETYERIRRLPPERSDNEGRVRRIVAELGPTGTLLDVGSGLGVFPVRMKEVGWQVTALDPDPRAADHLRTRVDVKTVCADFFAAGDLGRFDLVTLNKVLEHVADPAAMLSRAAACLRPGGTVYVEVPDGETAAADGPDREELFIEHLYAFDPSSLELLARRAGFDVIHLERIHEPSTKYTLFAFLHPHEDGRT